MSETNQEPTMEEILASIRRIISEDDVPAEGEAAAEAAPAPAPVAEPEPLPTFASMAPVEDAPLEFDDDVLELTDRLDEPMDTVEALDMNDLEVVAPAPRFEMPAVDLPPISDDEHLVGEPASYSAASAFNALERSILMPAAGRTLEDVVREMLRPMLKAWLDENLPSIVEAQVAAEVQRIARMRH
jgi:cell pole-organizing protein PopZ